MSVDLPDQKGRLEILKVHARNKKVAEDVELQEIAMRTPGFAGANLMNLLNEAAILAGRRGLKAITLKEIDDSIDRIVAGLEGKPLVDGKAKALVAYHEVRCTLCWGWAWAQAAEEGRLSARSRCGCGCAAALPARGVPSLPTVLPPAPCPHTPVCPPGPGPP